MKKLFKILFSLLLASCLVGCSNSSSDSDSSTKTYRCGHYYDNASVEIVETVDSDNKILKEEYTYTYTDYASSGYESFEDMKQYPDTLYSKLSFVNFNYSSTIKNDTLIVRYTLDYENNSDDFAYIAELFFGISEDEIADYEFFTFEDDGTCELVD